MKFFSIYFAMMTVFVMSPAFADCGHGYTQQDTGYPDHVYLSLDNNPNSGIVDDFSIPAGRSGYFTFTPCTNDRQQEVPLVCQVREVHSCPQHE